MSQQEWADTTPQRLQHAERAGLGTDECQIYLPSGLPDAGRKRRQIEGPLDCALRHRWIDSEQKLAGDRFIWHVHGARAQLQYSTSKSEVVDGGSSCRVDSLVERRSFHLTQLRKSLQVIDKPRRQPFLDWCVKSIQVDTSVAEFGAQFTPLNHREAKKAVGIDNLSSILDRLAKHYGFI